MIAATATSMARASQTGRKRDATSAFVRRGAEGRPPAEAATPSVLLRELTYRCQASRRVFMPGANSSLEAGGSGNHHDAVVDVRSRHLVGERRHSTLRHLPAPARRLALNTTARPFAAPIRLADGLAERHVFSASTPHCSGWPLLSEHSAHRPCRVSIAAERMRGRKPDTPLP